MEVRKIEGDLTGPAASAWSGAARQSIALSPIPIDAQPTEYIRLAWATRPYGRVGEVAVSVARAGDRAFVRLEWADSDEPNTEFGDAAAVYFPGGGGDAPAHTLGSDEGPVTLWHWGADRQAARSLVSTGPGRFAPSGTNGVTATAELTDGRWAVVLEGDADALGAGRIGVVVWDGANEERAGIGAATTEWIPLEVASQGGAS
jgi:DMSO reductase family type II enzyme heme b subunit